MLMIVILSILFSITTFNRGNVPSNTMPGPLGDPYFPMPGPYFPMPGPFAGPLDFQYDDQFPLTPEEDLRSFDSDYGQGLPSYNDQFPLTPEEDLRSFDSFQ